MISCTIFLLKQREIFIFVEIKQFNIYIYIYDILDLLSFQAN